MKKVDRINVRLNEKIKRKLAQEAKLKDITISQVVRSIVTIHYLRSTR